MSTRSLVGLLDEEKGYILSYVHYDGYFDGVGMELFKNFNSYDDAEYLANRGAAPTLESDPYGDEEPRCYSDTKSLVEALKKSDVEFIYVWIGEWHAAKVIDFIENPEFQTLDHILLGDNGEE